MIILTGQPGRSCAARPAGAVIRQFPKRSLFLTAGFELRQDIPSKKQSNYPLHRLT